jgi:hypothetical protein
MGKIIKQYGRYFLQGMAQSVDILGLFQSKPYPFKRKEYRGLDGDWEKIGGDFRRAIVKFKDELGNECRRRDE